ncbi:HPr kinase/phosphatase C-terminal domain-containing protein [Devosia sp. 1566]|uniref:HPr kinase/phosphorylase n=1 Tax=Devosia sp. 1566 TaxID=2499144 RepID=UPI000FDB77A4|nr:HPr kinase/phosphatase C-terminal domain-containing protein [Devosia sp. 1566]
MNDAAVHVHATAVLLGQVGVLIRGASGSGKSLLALALLDYCHSLGVGAALVADDQVRLSRIGESLSMAAPELLAGLIELRFRGIVSRAYQSPIDLHLIVDLVPDPVRMPEADAFCTDLLGVPVARAPVPQGSLLDLGHQVLLVMEAVNTLGHPSGQNTT